MPQSSPEVCLIVTNYRSSRDIPGLQLALQVRLPYYVETMSGYVLFAM